MKKSFVTAIICLIFIAFLSNFTTKSVKSFVITTVNEGPVLPQTPLDYSDVTFPAHLLSPPDDLPTGYEAGPIDTFTINNLDNDKATLGRVLFYDEKLSALENISCASCHIQEKSFADEVALSEGISSLTKRNSMALNDLGWSNKSHFFWDMSETDLHEMIVLPLTDENEIGANMADIQTKLSSTEYYPELFEKAFGTASIDEERIVDALVHFINSMVTFDSKFDRASNNDFSDFTEKEMLGLELFSVNCTSCHSQGAHDPFGFGEEEFFPPGISELEMFPFIFNNGLPVDEVDNGAGSWDAAFENLFKIPSLRNVALTGPYMHDGRFETLEEVLDHYSEEVEENEWSFFMPPGGFDFTTFEKDALIAFMNTLTDESFRTNEKWSNPFETTASVPDLVDIDFVIKPNPMLSEATIEFENPNSENVSINILSSTGQLIETRKVNDDFFTLDKNNFSAGMYFVEVRIGEASSLKKLIVQ